MFATALGLLGALGLSACKLETSGLCNFSRNACIFQDNSARSSELGIPLDSFINRPINANSGNEDCRIPQENETFYILIEPCWSNGTATPDDLAECPDVPTEYYEANAIPVLSHDSRQDDSIGLVSGRPTELNILNIGANYMFEGKTDASGQTPKADFDSVTRLDKFQFRTIPINDNSWKALLSQVNSKVKMLALVTNRFVQEKMTLDPLSEFYTYASETMPLRSDQKTASFATYSQNERSSDFKAEEWIYKRKRTLEYCMGSFYRNFNEMNWLQGFDLALDFKNTSTEFPTPGENGWKAYKIDPYERFARSDLGVLVSLPGPRGPVNPRYVKDSQAKRQPAAGMACGSATAPCIEPGFGPEDTDTPYGNGAKLMDNFVYPYMSILGCQEEFMYVAPLANKDDKLNPVGNMTNPPITAGSHISEAMSLVPSPNASFEMWIESGFNDIWNMILATNTDGTTRDTATAAAIPKGTDRYWPAGEQVKSPGWNNRAQSIGSFMRNDPSVPTRADLTALQSAPANFHSMIGNGAFWCSQGTVFCNGVPPQKVFDDGYTILSNFMNNSDLWGPFGRDSIGKIAGCNFKTNKYRGISSASLYDLNQATADGSPAIATGAIPTLVTEKPPKFEVPNGTFNFKQPKPRSGEYPANLNEKGLIESDMRLFDVNEYARAQEVRLMRYNVSAVNKVQSQYLYNMRGCLDYLERPDVQKKLVKGQLASWLFSTSNIENISRPLDHILYNFMQILGPRGPMTEHVPDNKLVRDVNSPELDALAKNMTLWNTTVPQDFSQPLVLNQPSDLILATDEIHDYRARIFNQRNRSKYIDDVNSTGTGIFGPPAWMDTDRFVKDHCNLPIDDELLLNLKVCYTPDIFAQMASRPPKADNLLAAFREWRKTNLFESTSPKWMRNLAKHHYFSQLAVSYCYLGLEARSWGSRGWEMKKNGMTLENRPGAFPYKPNQPADSRHNDLYNPIAHTYVPYEMLHVYRLPMFSGQEEQYDTVKDSEPSIANLEAQWDQKYQQTLNSLKDRYCFPFLAFWITPDCDSDAESDALRETLATLGLRGDTGGFNDGCRMATYESPTPKPFSTESDLNTDQSATPGTDITDDAFNCLQTINPKCKPYNQSESGDEANVETWWQMTTANASNRISPFVFTSGDATGNEPRWAEDFHGPRFTTQRYVYQSLSESMRVQNGLDWLSSKIEGTSVYAQQTVHGCLFTENDMGNDELADLFRHAALARGDAMDLIMNPDQSQNREKEALPPLPYEPPELRPKNGKDKTFNTNFIQNKLWCLFYQDEINARSYPSIVNGRGTSKSTAAYKANDQRNGADLLYPTPFKPERTPVIQDYCTFERYTEGVGEKLNVFYRKRDQASCADAVSRARWAEQKAGTYTGAPRCNWYAGSQNDFLKKINDKTVVIKAKNIPVMDAGGAEFTTVSYKRNSSDPDENEYGTCEGGGEMYALDASSGAPKQCKPTGFRKIGDDSNYHGLVSRCEGEDNRVIAMQGKLCGFGFPQNASRRECNVQNEGQPRNPEKSALFAGRCVANPDADWSDFEFPPHVNAFVGEGATPEYTTDNEEPITVTSDTVADNECKDQCMIYATANIVTNHYRSVDNATNQWMKKIQSENNDIKNEAYFSGFGLVGRMRNSAVGTASSPVNQSKGMAMSENVYENLIDRGYFGAFAPWQELTCPMEITIADDRTQSMSPKQQFENIYVSAVEMVGDIPITTEALGRGCYMCTKAKSSIYDTLKNEEMWTNQFNEEACSIESMLPSMEGVPYFTGTMDPLGGGADYVPDYYEGTDDKANIYDRMRWRDSNLYKTVTDSSWVGTKKASKGFQPVNEPGEDQPTLNDFNFDSMKQFRPNRNVEHFKSIGGIYTLYPYVKVPSLAKDADRTKQVRWETLITQQLDYMYNPAWHITVEVTGLSKAKGRPVLRNFHGRILEENLADFDVERYAHQDPVNLYKVPGFDAFTRGLETTPAMCLTSFFNSQSGNKDDVQIKEYDCVSDMDQTETTIKGSKQYEYSIDFDNAVEGQAEWMQTLLGDTDPILRLIMADHLSASEDAVDNPSIPFDDRFFVVQRNDGDCEAQLGEVEVTFHMGLMCADIMSDIILDDVIDVALGAVMGILLGPESAPIIAAEIGMLAGGAQVLSEAGVFNPSDFFHHQTHTEKFSSCKPAYVAGNWTNGATGSRYVKAAFQAMRKRISLNSQIMCTDGDWLHNKECDACFALPEQADLNEVNFTSYNFDWFQLLKKQSKAQCDSEDTYGGNPSERAQCGTYSYEVQLGPLNLGFNKYKRKGESRARFGLMGAPDDMFGYGDMCQNIANRYCGGDFTGTDTPGACFGDKCAQGDDPDPDQCNKDMVEICTKQSPEQRMRMFKEYEPTVKVTRMDKPCIFEMPATFFATYNPSAYFGYIGGANWTKDWKTDPSQLNLDNPMGGTPNQRQIQFKNIFGHSDDRCLAIPAGTGISDTAEAIGVGCGIEQSELNKICSTNIDGSTTTAAESAECVQLLCCGGETGDSTPMWSQSGQWENPDNDETYWNNQKPREAQQFSFRTNNKVYGYPNIQHKLCYRDLDDPPHGTTADFSPPGLWEAVRRRDSHTLVERPDESTLLDMKSLEASLNIISLEKIEVATLDALVNVFSGNNIIKLNYDILMRSEQTRYSLTPQEFLDELFNNTGVPGGGSIAGLQRYLQSQLTSINADAKQQIEKSMRTFDGLGITSWRPFNVDKNVHDPYRAITDEINILGVHISSPLFSGTPENQFPGTMIFTSKHKKIHARIVRSLGQQAGTDMGCNVFYLGRPNVLMHNMELDNSDCQEQLLNQLGSSGPLGKTDEFLTNSDLFQKAFLNLRGWETAAVRLTKPYQDKDPENVMLSDVRITSSLNFRKMFPGRPLISADSQSRFGTVSVDNLVLTGINDTHMYRDTRDPSYENAREQPVPLMPIHAVFWGFKGVVNLGHFPDPFDVVLYGNGNNFAAERFREGTPSTSKNCTGFTEASLYNDYGGNLTEFTAACTSTPTNFTGENCTVFVSALVTILHANGTVHTHSDHCVQNDCANGQKSRSFFCYQKEFIDTSDVIALDGRDFFDVAADRFACFEAPKLHCTFNYVSNAIAIVVGWVAGYIFLRAIFKFADVYSQEPCISITSTLETQLAEAGVAMIASEVGSITVRKGFEKETNITLKNEEHSDDSYETDDGD